MLDWNEDFEPSKEFRKKQKKALLELSDFVVNESGIKLVHFEKYDYSKENRVFVEYMREDLVTEMTQEHHATYRTTMLRFEPNDTSLKSPENAFCMATYQKDIAPCLRRAEFHGGMEYKNVANIIQYSDIFSALKNICGKNRLTFHLFPDGSFTSEVLLPPDDKDKLKSYAKVIGIIDSAIELYLGTYRKEKKANILYLNNDQK